MKKFKFHYLHQIIKYLDYEPSYKKCESVHIRISKTGFVKYLLFIYLFILNLFSFIRPFINVNKNFILFRFIAGVIILVFESDSISSINLKKQNKNVNHQENIYDIAVVGSGPGGAIGALRSVEKGKRVILIEAGSIFSPGTIEHHSLDQTTNHFKNQGMNFCYGNIPMLYAEGSTYGGGSEVNSGLYFKLTEPYRSSFLDKCKISEDEWAKYEKKVEEILYVQKAPTGTFDGLKSALIEGSNRNGLICEEVPRWRTYEPIEDHKSMQVTYLKIAEEKGLDVLSDLEVKKIFLEKEFIKINGFSKSKSINIRAKKVILASGTIGTPQILKNSNLLKDKIQFNFHPMNRAVVEYSEDVNDGDLFPPYQSWTKDYKFKFGYSVSTYPYVKATLASLGMLKDCPNEKRLVSYFSSTVLESSKGRLLNIGGQLIPFCFLKKNDRKKIKKGFSILKDLLTASDAINVWPNTKLSPLTTVHVFGSLPLNQNSDLGELGELKIDKRVKICDASLLPQAPWGNPQAVVMVLNEILMERWLANAYD